MCDLLFLEYLFSGRSCDGGKFLKKKNDEFEMKTTKSARKVGEWVKADCFLAKLADLQVFLR